MPGTKKKKNAPRQGGRHPIVALGASAGGFDAFKRFLANVPPDSGLAYVLISHLSPDRRSNLSDLLGRHTKLRVTEAKDEMPVRPDRVYVMPPGTSMTIRGSLLRLRSAEGDRTKPSTIDTFFRSLAEERNEWAAAVILSGTGSDGTIGLRAIKEHGGVALAQSGETAQYDGMMRSAVASGLVDFVLPAEELPAKLIDYFRHLSELHGKGPPLREAHNHVAEICTALMRHTGHDFSRYKRSTLERRITRRMQVLQIQNAEDYLERIRKEAAEGQRLFKDLLIGVTHFFRDPKTFQSLEKNAVARLVGDCGKAAQMSSGSQIRAWVAGCATGEEAYSIAMLFAEQVSKRRKSCKVQILASDIDEVALQTARIGRYPASTVQDVPPRRLERFFIREDGSYRVSNELREMCIFAPHNLLRDPPFSRMDLIACRNLLIYLNNELQNRVIPLLHYALRPGGYLFLGTSENVTQHAKLFSPVDKTGRIFRRRETAAQTIPEIPLFASGGRGAASAREFAVPSPTDLTARAERLVLQRHGPAYVIVTDQYEVISFFGDTSRYLRFPTGAPNMNLVQLARPGLRPDLRAALHEVVKSGRPIVRQDVAVELDDGREPVELIVEPIADHGKEHQLYVVIFKDLGAPRKSTGRPKRDEGSSNDQRNIVALEEELRATRERLQSTTEELESSNEELKSSNEELASMSEELQSSNEELETSKEELQSINEELHTVNAELNSRVEELGRANSDLKNLLENTRIATVFLDTDLRIRSFTPAVTELLYLVESDVGRNIGEIKPRFQQYDLRPSVERVVRTLAQVEDEVQVPERGASYILRVLPYRTVENVIDGVVLTFIDITGSKRAEREVVDLNKQLRLQVDDLARLAAIVASSYDPIIGTTPDGTITTWNLGAERAYGYSESEAIGQSLDRVTPKGRAVEAQQILEKVRRGELVQNMETVRQTKAGREMPVGLTCSAIKNPEGEIVGISFIERDLREAKAAEQRQKMLMAELDHRVKNSITVVGSMISQTLKAARSPADFAEQVQARLKSFAGVHSLLTEQSWSGVSIARLLALELGALEGKGDTRVTTHGPDVVLEPNTALTLTMVIHELATNAAKYGALSVDEGVLEVRWKVAKKPNRCLVLHWNESGGPPVQRPSRKGFGSSLIEQAIEYELDGRASMTFGQKGVRCTLEVPLVLRDAAAPPRQTKDRKPAS